MIVDTQYMRRCIQLASKGKGHTSPNPMVGAVLVCDDKIIGEGYHKQCGEAHAEVNAIASVKNKSQLKKATLYVSLEPCSHYGKTPPCAQLIIDSGISNVVIGCLDPFPQVSGRGIKMLNDARINTKVGILEAECMELNKEFNTVQLKNRPYIYLKWAQSADGFMDRERTEENTSSTTLSNDFTKILVHKLRAEVDGIMVGTNTAVADNPSLTTRYWYGDNPIRIILDRTLRISKDSHVYDDSVKTIIITESVDFPINTKNTEYLNIPFNDLFLDNMYSALVERHISSLMVEGGSKLLQTVIDSQKWDEAFLEVTKTIFKAGTKAPIIHGENLREEFWKGSKRFHLRSGQI